MDLSAENSTTHADVPHLQMTPGRCTTHADSEPGLSHKRTNIERRVYSRTV